MKKILTVSIISLMMLAVVSASYDFNYDKPNLDKYSHSLFLISKAFGYDDPIVQLGYILFGIARYNENQLISCEIELKKEQLLNGGSENHNHQPRVQPNNPIIEEDEVIEIEFILGDANGDGVLDNLDITPLIDGITECLTGEKSDCPLEIYDLNQDGSIDNLDISWIVKILI